ncbi:exopolysaccharide biosynthesis polyprenyl glycosylphosphotransferase [Halosimplex carlsbadense 2-9-1]|uniref:Exopolysaccharide biosynthesis polyprenyl glycosylphosphotransferase n=1 Tax=Halosimplex carlsbadense 2-9-1 TaxID=797114 RepID=M0CK85_9EURY|nr:sugar transferase [Halosimplex carlsbadense]ELZ23700.1 exopolysaccharide biosynthesis polyprenyl glycosylphosphotransferase [Halosimplex carlsbadense 2-9-1]
MAVRWHYRVASVVGVAALTVFAVWAANLPLVQELFAQVPYFGRPAPAVLTGSDLTGAVSTALVVTLAAMWPLFKPRPRRILDTVLLTHKRVLLAMVGLAALGYYDYSYALPRPTLILMTALLMGALPAWTTAIRQRPSAQTRAVIIGDDPQAMEDLLASTDVPVLGYVSPPSSYVAEGERMIGAPEMADGGSAKSRLDELSNLGGLSRLDEVFVKHDIDTALLAFTETDRAEFFGALAECYEHGVAAKVHRDHADDILTKSVAGGDLVEVNLEPWDWQDYVAKRVFDVTFALSALIVLSPLIVLIAVAIKLDDRGPILYSQERTAEFGDTFIVYKFRTMTVGDENKTPSEDHRNDRITRAGQVLRKAHLDEIPQLLAICTGKMSVVGPRAAWTDEETLIEDETDSWRKRWFVKPGLTGLAQVKDASSTRPQEKVRYDVAYIRHQSFWFDLKIVIRQVWKVLVDIFDTIIR